MAWSIPTYAGLRATGQPSNYRVAMFELCRAINEREVALGTPGGVTNFYKADGSQGKFVSMADLENLPCSGVNSYAELNMSRIQTAIFSSLGAYTESSGDTTVWTVSSLSSAIGYNLNTAPTKINQASWWQAMQDALDRMIYAWGTWRPTAYASTIGRSETAAFHSTIADAWADRNYQNTNTLVVRGLKEGAGVAGEANGGLIGSWNAGYCSSYGWKMEPGVSVFRVGGVSQKNDMGGGVMSAAHADYVIFGELLTADIPFTIGDDSGDITNGDTDASCEISTWSIGATGYVTANATIPGSSPLLEETDPILDNDRRLGIVYCNNVRAYYDITSELTDQS